MGVERAVTRWYARQQILQGEIAALQARLAQEQTDDKKLAPAELALVNQLADAERRLLDLVPCPRPMMG